MRAITEGYLHWKRKEKEKEKRGLDNIIDKERFMRRHEAYRFKSEEERQRVMAMPELMRNQFLKYPHGQKRTPADDMIEEVISEVEEAIEKELFITRGFWHQGWLITDLEKAICLTFETRVRVERYKRRTKKAMIKEVLKEAGIKLIDFYGDTIDLEERLIEEFKTNLPTMA